MPAEKYGKRLASVASINPPLPKLIIRGIETGKYCWLREVKYSNGEVTQSE
jgi:hypothetical protein